MTNNDLIGLSKSRQARIAYFSDPTHQRDVLWTKGDEPHGFDFGYLQNANSNIQVIDVFQGVRPLYHDALNPDGNGVMLVTVPTLILDSDVAGHIQAFVDNEMRDTQARERIERFLRWFASTPQMNINPAYNLLERFPRSIDPVKAESMAQRTATAVLKIETMDRSHYLESGNIRPAPDAQRILHSQTGISDFTQIARNAVADTKRLRNDEVEWFCAFLLKVALINATHTKPKDLVAKVDDLVAFLEQRLGRIGPLELVAAMLQFTGKLRKFVTISRSMAFEAVISRVEHAAWDLVYMRTPQMFLTKATRKHMVLAFIITGDRDSASIIRLSRFNMLLSTPGRPMYFYDTDFDSVGASYNNDLIFDEAMQHLNSFLERRHSMPSANITTLIHELHTELRSFLIP